MEKKTKKSSKKAKFVEPPNLLKKKVGSGGLSEKILNQAQKLLENNSIEFAPIAEMYLASLLKAIDRASYSTGRTHDEVINELVYPVQQLRANGDMFDYTLITIMAKNLIHFLNTVDQIDGKVLEITQAFHTSMNVVVHGKIRGDGGDEGRELLETLQDACDRYYNRVERHRKHNAD
mgnify:CR=1 FL=1